MRLLKIVPDDTNIDFVRLRYWAFGLTTLLTIAAIALVVVNKLNMGVDFVGGIMIEEKFQTPPDVERVRSVVDNLHFGDAQIQTVGDQKTLSIRLPRPETADDAATNRIVNAVSAALVKNFPGAQFSKQDAARTLGERGAPG
jgi:preprotein translocase subunit SecF